MRTFVGRQSRITRRSVLRGAGGAAVALPFLEATAARGATAGVPKRLVIYFNGQGTVNGQWTPSSFGTLGALPPMLDSLEPYKAKLNVLAHISNLVRKGMQGNDHIPAGCSLMTAQQYAPGSDLFANGPSIEQVIAGRIQGPAKYKTLDLRVGNVGVGEYQLFYSAPNVPVSGDGDPNRVFSRLFSATPPATGGGTGGTSGGTTTPPPAPTTLADRLRGRRAPLVDLVLGRYKALSAQLAPEDKQRLEAHADRLTELENTLKTTNTPAPTGGASGSSGAPPNGGTSGATCSKPVLGLPSGYDTSTSHDPDSNKAMAKLAAMALACDYTRVITVQHMEYDSPRFPWLNLGLPSGWHDFVHNHGAGAPDKLARGFHWYTDAFADFLKELDSIQENGKSLLDNTLVLRISEFGDGGDHDTTNLPVVLAGSLGGALQTGRALNFTGRTTNDLFVTLLNLFGGTETSFGYGGSSLNKGPLPL